MKDILHIGDYLSKLKVTHQVQIETLQRRKRLLAKAK